MVWTPSLAPATISRYTIVLAAHSCPAVALPPVRSCRRSAGNSVTPVRCRSLNRVLRTVRGGSGKRACDNLRCRRWNPGRSDCWCKLTTIERITYGLYRRQLSDEKTRRRLRRLDRRVLKVDSLLRTFKTEEN